MQNKFTYYAEAEQGRGTQESPQWQHSINVVACRLRGDCHVGQGPPRNDTHNNVILNEVKNLKVSETMDGSTNLEILRVAQDDKTQRGDCHVGQSPPRNDGVQHQPRNDAHTNNVILNVVKNLKVSETVDGSTNLEILRVAQDDKTQRRDCHEPKIYDYENRQ